MNMAFDGIVLSRVTELLNETIVTGRISKLYQISKYELLMTVRAQNENKKLLVSIVRTCSVNTIKLSYT